MLNTQAFTDILKSICDWNERLLFKYDMKRFSLLTNEILNLIVSEIEFVKIFLPRQARTN